MASSFSRSNPIENAWDALGRQLLVESILRQTRTPSSVHSQRNGINCLNSCWIMLCKSQGLRDLSERVSEKQKEQEISYYNCVLSGRLARKKELENVLLITLDMLTCCDEAHFWLNGYVKKQNCRIWSEANPQVYVETPLHPETLTVRCALWAGGIIGPYFLKNDEGHNVTVNGDRYRALITNFFIPELNKHDVQELWFQQDGATCHTARATIDLLKDTFGDCLISRFGPVTWPPRSCDLTPLDYFLWAL
ncbi:transposable element Tc3 transposase [Trichonephila clavipes]|nr:transposable element Tc3 transposase [Trichonephila clavipes]